MLYRPVKPIILSLLMITSTAQASPLALLAIGTGFIVADHGQGGLSTDTTYYQDGKEAETVLLYETMSAGGEKITRHYGYHTGDITAVTAYTVKPKNRPLILTGLAIMAVGVFGLSR